MATSHIRRSLLVVAAAAVAAAGFAYVGTDTRAARKPAVRSGAVDANPADAIAPVVLAPEAAHASAAVARSSSSERGGGDVAAVAGASRPHRAGAPPRTRESLMLTLPPALLELVKTTRWDDEASAVLETFVTTTFDADGDGAISDRERIDAVRALRDAVWEDTGAEPDGPTLPEDGRTRADSAPATLSEADRRLHHEVDQARRRDHADFGGDGPLDGERRSAIVVRFEIDDDGRVTAAELARYLDARRAGLPAADLNGDGAVDDADLRAYLDVASPIVAD
jgi:hypothetical protein